MQRQKRAQQHRAALLPGLPEKSMCLDAGVPGATPSKVGPYPGCSGRRLAAFRVKKRAYKRKKGGVGKRTRGKKPLFCVQRSWLWRHLSEKQQVKDGGVCRVIWTSTRVYQPNKAHASHPSAAKYACAYRKKPPYSLFICLISAIPAPDNWCIGRVAISGTRSDVCVTPRTRHTVGLKGASP